MAETGFDADYTEARITKLKTIVDAYEDALIAFAADGAMEEFRVDTGQSIITVKRSNIFAVKDLIASLTSQIAELSARRFGGGTTYVRPAW